MRKFIFIGIILFELASAHAQTNNPFRSTTIEVNSLKSGKNHLRHEGMDFEITYQKRKIVKVKRLLPGGRKQVYKLNRKPPTSDVEVEICWEDYEKKMSICIKCTCKGEQ